MWLPFLRYVALCLCQTYLWIVQVWSYLNTAPGLSSLCSLKVALLWKAFWLLAWRMEQNDSRICLASLIIYLTRHRNKIHVLAHLQLCQWLHNVHESFKLLYFKSLLCLLVIHIIWFAKRSSGLPGLLFVVLTDLLFMPWFPLL